MNKIEGNRKQKIASGNTGITRNKAQKCLKNKIEGIEGIESKSAEKPKQPPQYPYWSFTFNNYQTDSEGKPINYNMGDMLQTILMHECDWFVYQEEIGEEEKTPHLQGNLKLKGNTGKRLSAMKKFHPSIHWKPTFAITGSLAYCGKEKTRAPNGNIWVHGIDIYVPPKVKLIEPYGWQLEVLEYISREPDDREILWIWEPKGGVGKSKFCKYLFMKHHAVLINGGSKDIFHAVAKAQRRELFVCNVPKSSSGYINYGAIEMIKDGLVFSGKYEGAQLCFNNPHVIVFCNIPPDLDQMTGEGRWNINLVMKEPSRLVRQRPDLSGR